MNLCIKTELNTDGCGVWFIYTGNSSFQVFLVIFTNFGFFSMHVRKITCLLYLTVGKEEECRTRVATICDKFTESEVRKRQTVIPDSLKYF